jgi:nitroreductase
MSDKTITAPSDRWLTVSTTIRERRSNANVDLERPVSREIVDDLIDLATAAPNHYRTNPWRFVVMTGAARSRIGALAADVYSSKPDANAAIAERQRNSFLRAPTVIAVASAADADPIKDFENKHSVAAGVQNMLVAATAAGLASAWRSGPAMVDPDVSAKVKEAIGLDPTDEIVAFVYLGYPTGEPSAKPPAQKSVKFLEE